MSNAPNPIRNFARTFASSSFAGHNLVRLGVAGSITAASLVATVTPALAEAQLSCKGRTIALAMSSSERSPRFVANVANIVTRAAVQAAICQTPLTVVAVTGSQVLPVLESSDLRPRNEITLSFGLVV
jgi:hypothetical protein